ncbi:hypothetical protein EJB05_40832 [Eragrostis curvula]|uniref:Uncharacterized protein n=1 Tax=Eragrostis curvula TaxID=38414 RepID=A0A5J9TP97_9POAL|nr:hypothetical protein EJB05_40832 [Eragrostis curvula]
MASRLVAAAVSSSSASSSSRIISRRGLAGVADHRGLDQKVNLWEAPMSPMKWKNGQFVIATTSIWAGLVYGGFELFDGKKEDESEAPQPKKSGNLGLAGGNDYPIASTSSLAAGARRQLFFALRFLLMVAHQMDEETNGN